MSPGKGTPPGAEEIPSAPAEEPASANDHEKPDDGSMTSSTIEVGSTAASSGTVTNGDMVSAEALAGHTELRRRNVPKGSGDTEGTGLGKVQVTLRYSSQRNKLIVVVHKAENLPAMNSDNTSDPYVRLYLLPDKSNSGRKKTRVIKEKLNPTFDETFEFHCNSDEAQQRVIDMVVKNSAGMFSQSKNFIGQAFIHLSELDLTKASTVWYALHSEGTSVGASTPSLSSGTAV